MFSNRTSWNRTTNRLSEALARHRASGRPLFDLSVSNPTECGFFYDNHAIMRALCSPASLQYHPDPRGLSLARLAVVQYYVERDQQVGIDDIILTTSTSEAYSFVFRLLCNAGDEVLAPSPSYPLFDFLADIQDVKIKPYSFVYDHGWQIDLHGLQQAITPETRGIIVVHPNNPSGSFVKLEELDRQIAGQRHCARLEVEGGWYCVLRIPATRSDEDLALALLEQQGVFVHPGHFYDFAQDGYLIVSMITPQREFGEGIKRLLSAVG